MTVGAGGALNVVMRTLLDPGDEVVIFAPYFVEYFFYADNHGATCKVVPADENIPSRPRRVGGRHWPQDADRPDKLAQ